MPKLTHLVRETARPLREYDITGNTLVFKHPSNDAVDTDVPHEMLQLYSDQWSSGGTGYETHKIQYGSRDVDLLRLRDFAQGSNSAMWPGLAAKERQVKS